MGTRHGGGTVIDLGQVAYEAYCEKTGGRSAVTGEPLPTWEDQAPEIRAAWTTAGEAVAHVLVREVH
jgi:hypothetical protein